MTLTINLNHQPQLRAEEIDDEMMNRLLTHKLVTEHVSSLQMIPKQNLRQGAVVSEFPRALLQIFSVEDPQHNPLTPLSKGNNAFNSASRPGDVCQFH